MELTELQTELLKLLQAAVEAKQNSHVVYCTEWLGELPFGVYQWVEVDGKDISRSFPSGWSRADLDVLQNAGLVEKVDEWQNPDDEFETKITYEVSSASLIQ